MFIISKFTTIINKKWRNILTWYRIEYRLKSLKNYCTFTSEESLMMQKLIIETDRLKIRNLKETDLMDFLFYRSNPEVTKYQGFDVFNKKQAEAFIQDQIHKKFGKAGEWVQYGIENNKTHKIIGDCAIKLNQYDTRIAEIGITISHIEQKKAYAKETLIGILSFLFEMDDFHRVSEIVDAENIASIALLKSLGFKQEGHFIENVFFKGKWGSECQFAMLKSEWEVLKVNFIYDKTVK
ncbi:MAG TPA: GNAT family N-acetyltransferase [Edaphocola sp.]|nr:GNAT family N-acetyltransferase [Edaphocola sp.]